MLVFGHDFSVNATINNTIHGYDLEYSSTVNDKEFEVSNPYHGGQIAGDTFSVVCGYTVSDDDSNKQYLKQVKQFVEADYLADYLAFVEEYKEFLLETISETDDEDEKTEIQAVYDFFGSHEPSLYSVEVSS